MGLILTITAGLSVWIVFWALGVKGFDGFLITALMVIIAIAIRNVVRYLPRRGDQ
jgi:hypothetical protein